MTTSDHDVGKLPTEVLPKAGLVYSEKGNLSDVLAKPKIMPIKSVTLEKLEQMEAAAQRGPATQQQPEAPMDAFDQAAAGMS